MLGRENALPQEVRRIILEESKRAHVGHIGSALSIVELLSALYGGTLRLDGTHRDRFVLSKGHAALALYATLAATGRIERDAVSAYCTDGSPFGAHPEHVVDEIDFSTGSLGQGLSIATGAALAARMQRSPRRAFALLSDAECNEGSVWEAAMFAAHHRLANLVAVVDVNGQQALGYTRDVLDLSPLAERWRAFGWDAIEVDGHDVDELARTIESLDTDAGPPHVLLARTVFGKGVSYMESQIKWHYWPMSDEEFELAMGEIEDSAGAPA